jgi:hypothetical protein
LYNAHYQMIKKLIPSCWFSTGSVTGSNNRIF